jgi:hypothetical protein
MNVWIDVRRADRVTVPNFKGNVTKIYLCYIRTAQRLAPNQPLVRGTWEAQIAGLSWSVATHRTTSLQSRFILVQYSKVAGGSSPADPGYVLVKTE